MRLIGKATTLSAILLTFSVSANAESEKVRNLILMIGDGMGPQQLSMLESYANLAPNSIYQGRKTALSELADNGVVGLSMTYPYGSLVVDSASSASQLATGEASLSEAIGLDKNGNSVETILEKAQRSGKATGLVSDTRLTHATPAAFAAHRPHRSLENEIAGDMLGTKVDVMLSGGIRHWLPQSVNEKGQQYQELLSLTGGQIKIKSKRKDERNLLQEAKQSGYELAFNRNDMMMADGDRLLGLFAYSGMMDGIEYTKTKNSEERVQPTLKEMTVKALDILSQDKDGFFLMVEGGQIDWAAHNNDAATMLHELLKFDEAVSAVYEWASDRKDTLVVVTSDHETGSFGFSYSAVDLPEAENIAGGAFNDRTYKPNFNFGSPDILDNLYRQSASFYGIFDQFRQLPGKDQTAVSLANIVAKNSPFTITEEQAARVLKRAANPFKVKGHKYLSAETLPEVKDFKAFYVYGNEIKMNLLGRELAAQQNVVWGTGTHTSTPVTVMAYGPEEVAVEFRGMQHHTQVGKKLINALR
ncbi:alkaline phosphatase [Endozoicomonas sp. (ex Bugula neritina AB1)]|nr:alkaline phosphatase [Endozoicomonas sp. (ex Bugula neritina AB1)]